MRKTSLLVPALVLALATPASAGPTTTGTISVGNPMAILIGGVTELGAPCDPTSELQGADGWWITLAASSANRPATLVSDGADTNVYFYDAGCGFVSDEDDPVAYDMATELTADEAGTVPASAAFAVVDLIVGADATFTFTVG